MELARQEAERAEHLLVQSRRYRIFASYCGCFMSLGIVIGSLGPTMKGLSEQVGYGSADLGVLFVSRGLGYMVGSLVSMKLYDGVLSGHRLLSAAVLLMAASCFAVSVIFNYYLMVGQFLLIGVLAGLLDVGPNVLIMWLFGDGAGPYMNFLHFAFGLGAFISPMIIGATIEFFDSIRLAYVCMAVLLVPVSIGPILSGPPPKHSDTTASKAVSIRSVGYIVPLALTGVFLFLYVGAEVSFGGWIFTYALRLELMSESLAAVLSATFWGAVTVGRLATVPISKIVSSRVIIALDVTMSMCSLLIFPTFIHIHDEMQVWIGTICLGISMGALFPEALRLLDSYIGSTAFSTSCVVIMAVSGEMTVPLAVGYAMEHGGSVFLVIITFITFFGGLLCFLGLQTFQVSRKVGTHRKGKNPYAKQVDDQAVEIGQDAIGSSPQQFCITNDSHTESDRGDLEGQVETFSLERDRRLSLDSRGSLDREGLKRQQSFEKEDRRTYVDSDQMASSSNDREGDETSLLEKERQEMLDRVRSASPISKAAKRINSSGAIHRLATSGHSSPGSIASSASPIMSPSHSPDMTLERVPTRSPHVSPELERVRGQAAYDPFRRIMQSGARAAQERDRPSPTSSDGAEPEKFTMPVVRLSDRDRAV